MSEKSSRTQVVPQVVPFPLAPSGAPAADRPRKEIRTPVTTTTNTNGSATATVETLTAQVHVLKVGNRQITLSVVKQLDRVGLNELEPFGRIRTGRDAWFSDPEYCERPVIELIGRHTETGALARSCALVPRAGSLSRVSHVSGGIHPLQYAVTLDDYLGVYTQLPRIVLAGLR